MIIDITPPTNAPMKDEEEEVNENAGSKI